MVFHNTRPDEPYLSLTQILETFRPGKFQPYQLSITSCASVWEICNFQLEWHTPPCWLSNTNVTASLLSLHYVETPQRFDFQINLDKPQIASFRTMSKSFQQARRFFTSAQQRYWIKQWPIQTCKFDRLRCLENPSVAPPRADSLAYLHLVIYSSLTSIPKSRKAFSAYSKPSPERVSSCDRTFPKLTAY